MDSKTTTTYRGLPPSLRTPSFGAPASPHQRYSPGGSLHGNEDLLILEVGSRLLRAGFANEPSPRCQLAWNDSLWRRVGDKVSSDSVGKRQGGRCLWDLEFALHDDKMDVDERVRRQMGLVEDLVERGLRIAYNKHLLIDSKTRKILLPVPPLFPTKVLTAILATLFTHFQPPAVTLMSAPVLATIAAGLRCALVVDIGWDETIVTPVYELRAIEGRGVGVHGRCRRGIKVLREHWGLFLGAHLPEGIDPGLDETEEVMERLGYVISSPALENDTTTIPLAGRTVRIAFRDLARPAEKTFFSVTSAHQEASPDVSDDDDTPLPELLYNALLHSAIDVRAACVSRIIFVGGGSKIPGLQARVLEELRGIIARKGWVVGFRTPPPHPEEEEEGGIARERDSEAEKKAFVAAGEVRGVKSLGVWCGGSLFAGLKVRAKAEVERERFLSQVASGGTGLPHGW